LTEETASIRVVAGMTIPRLSFSHTWACVQLAAKALGITVWTDNSVYWEAGLSRLIHRAIDQGCEWFISLDFDSIFSVDDLRELMTLAVSSNADIICAAQMKRGKDPMIIATVRDADGTTMKFGPQPQPIPEKLLQVRTGHWGMTAVRLSAMARVPEFWFPNTNEQGSQIDPDMAFWDKAERAGLKVCLAPNIRIGHLQEVVLWPDPILRPLEQYIGEWAENQKPPAGFSFDDSKAHARINLPPLHAFDCDKRNVYSQHGEDGVLKAIFSEIGAENKWVLEIGASDGLFMSNSRALIEDGWSAVLIESDAGKFERLQALYAGAERVHCVHMTCVDLDAALSDTPIPQDFDLAIIDVDGQDYHLWNGMLKYRPRVVCCEFSADDADDFIPQRLSVGQAGRRAIMELAAAKCYRPVAECGVNIISVQLQSLDLLKTDVAFVGEAASEPAEATT